MAEVWLRDPRRLRADPRFACAILGLWRKISDPRFAQQNPRMVRIRTLRLTYIYILMFNVYVVIKFQREEYVRGDIPGSPSV